MEKPFLTDQNYNPDIDITRKYLSGIVENVLIFILFVSIFFQFFPYYRGIFRISYYFSTIFFIFYFSLQALKLEGFNFCKPILFVYFIFICWMFYGLLSLFFSTNHEDGVWYMHLRFMSFFNFYVMTQFLVNQKRIRAYGFIVILCIIFNFGVCIWEITTFQHLPTSRYYEIPIYIPTGAFPNENDLPSAVLICVPILFFMKEKRWKYLCTVLMLLFLIITGFQGSRFCLFAFLPFFLYHYIFKTNKLYKIITIISVVLLVTIIIYKLPSVVFFAKKQIREHILSLKFEAESQRITSGRVRYELFIVNIEKMIDTYGFGVGIGNYEKSDNPERLHEAQQTVYAHNYFMEILANEGIIGFTLLCIIVLYVILPILKNKPSILALLNKNNYSETEKRVALFFIFYLVATNVPATICGYFIFWSMLGYNFALAYNCQAEKMI